MAAALGVAAVLAAAWSGAWAAPPVETVVHPAAAPGPLDNPLKGWCTYTGGRQTQPYSMVFRYVPWKELEPRPGEYRFAEWERRTWDIADAAGKHVVIRVYIDWPSSPSGMPDWLREQGVRLSPYRQEGGGLSPDYDDPRMVSAMVRLIRAMGRRYDRNPRVAFVQMGLLGFWGEWHTSPTRELFASPATQKRVLLAARAAFPHRQVMTRYPEGFAGAQDWLGYFDDYFPDDTDGPGKWRFLQMMRASGRVDAWKRHCIGGEMVPRQALKWMGDGFARTMQMVEAAHFSWVGPGNPGLEPTQSPEFVERCRQMVRRMGYEYRITEVRHAPAVRRGDALRVSVAGVNQGVAPFTAAWPVELALLDARDGIAAACTVRADIRDWLPGAFTLSARLRARATPGRYRLAIGIRDPWTRQPAVGFANDLPRIAGWTVLSEVDVTAR